MFRADTAPKTSDPQKCIDICGNYLIKYIKDPLSQLDAEWKFKKSTWFSSTGQIKYFSLEVVIKFLYGNFLQRSAIIPDHWLLHRHVIAFPCFLDRRLLFSRIIALLLFIFVYLLILLFFNYNTLIEVKGITHTLLWYNKKQYSII